ncbi:ATP-binding protein [Pyxidicoccus sp. QH1ED-7-1]|nr:ATP-binding protein [Pyxidicoccus xibeiensis]MCP3136641.1 ATP-binding protein [Pyxidicoccus xibeiensis]
MSGDLTPRLRASRTARYAVALVGVLLALALQTGLWPFMSASPFLFFFGAVMVAGWWGGWGPALVATALTLVLASYFFLPPLHGFSLDPGSIIAMAVFSLLALLMTKLNVMLRRAEAERAVLLEREREARRQAEAERARLHAVFMEAPANVVLLRGPDHVYTFSNARNNALLGNRPQVGRPAREAVAETVDQGLFDILDRVYATGEPFTGHALPLRFAQPDGSKRETFLNLVYQATRDASGRVDGVAGFGFDVTDLVHARQRAEALAAELLQAEARDKVLADWGAALASSLDYATTLRDMGRLLVPAFADWCLVDLVEPDGTFRRVEVAHAAPEDADLAREVLRFQLRPEGNPDHPPTAALLRGEALLIEGFTPERLEKSAHSPEHARVMRACNPVSFISVPLVARGHTRGVLSFFTSRSGRQYTQADLALGRELAHRAALAMDNARLYQEAREAIRLRDEFMSIASHELKTPLTPLSLKLQALARELSRHSDAVPRRVVESYVEVGTRQVKKLSELVGDLLDVSRIAAGRLTLELEDVELGGLVREVMARYEPHAARAGSTLRLEGADGPINGRWDRLRLEQVVTNLVDNAVKYGNGRPIHVSLGALSSGVRLSVRDEGIGIDPEHLPRLFGRFERAVSERHYGGLGLGLYITRTLVEAQGGCVRVESQPGLGSTFTVELPTHHLTPSA